MNAFSGNSSYTMSTMFDRWSRCYLSRCKKNDFDTTEIEPADFTKKHVFSFGMDPDSVDILTFSRGVSLDAIFDNATNARIDDLVVRIIDIHDLLKNKENLANRSEEKNLVDRQDILLLRRILKSR